MSTTAAEVDELRDFSNSLTALIAKYKELSKGARGYLLFVSFVALLCAEKGTDLTVEDVAKASAAFAARMWRTGVMKL